MAEQSNGPSQPETIMMISDLGKSITRFISARIHLPPRYHKFISFPVFNFWSADEISNNRREDFHLYSGDITSYLNIIGTQPVSLSLKLRLTFNPIFSGIFLVVRFHNIIYDSAPSLHPLIITSSVVLYRVTVRIHGQSDLSSLIEQADTKATAASAIIYFKQNVISIILFDVQLSVKYQITSFYNCLVHTPVRVLPT